MSKFLASRYDLSRVDMMGTSCGALCATLTACGVNPDRTLRSAYDLSLEANLWERPLGAPRPSPAVSPVLPPMLARLPSAACPLRFLSDWQVWLASGAASSCAGWKSCCQRMRVTSAG